MTDVAAYADSGPIVAGDLLWLARGGVGYRVDVQLRLAYKDTTGNIPILSGKGILSAAALMLSGDGGAITYLHCGTTGVQWRNSANSATLMTLTDAGQLGLGGAPSAFWTLRGARNTLTQRFHNTNNDSAWTNGDFLGRVEWYSDDASDGGPKPYARIDCENEGTTFGGKGNLAFSTASAAGIFVRFRITSDGNFVPGADNAYTMGSSSLRMANYYGSSSAILTSDAREKNWLGALTEAHLRAAKRIAGEIGLYQFLDAVAEKGDDARVHIGPRAQAVAEILYDEELEVRPEEGEDPNFRHAFLCWDKWEASPAVAELLGDDGEVLRAARPAIAAGDRYGVRVDQLALFLVAAQEARLAALEI